MTRSEAKRLKLTTTLADAHALADRALANVRAKHARASERSPRATGATREERRMGEIRVAVMRRAGYLCELCGAKAVEAHHLISGPLRRHMEREDTVIALCVGCHKTLHAGDLETLYHAQAYCVSAGMHDAGAALAKRIDKVLEARQRVSAPSTPATNTKEDDR